MDDREIEAQIEGLVAEEHRLLEAGEREGGLGADDHLRLGQVRVELDRLYDLKRQRRAQREAGRDPDGAAERDAETVEGYEQ